MTDPQSAILRDVESYYTARINTHGATPSGVDWNGTESHALRHRQFLRLLDGTPNAEVLDLGCGYGDFFGFLRANGHHGPFTGYDVSAAMIDHARRIHGAAEGCTWKVGAVPERPADFAIASGIFNVKGDVSVSEWQAYMQATIDILAESGRLGFAFNVLSLASDPERRRPNLYYADPCETLSYCLKKFGRSVALLQDYGLYEFTLLVRR